MPPVTDSGRTTTLEYTSVFDSGFISDNTSLLDVIIKFGEFESTVVNTSDSFDNSTSDTETSFEPAHISIAFSILHITIGVAGLLGNIMSIVVLSYYKMKSSINCYLIALAVFDSALILSDILSMGLGNLCIYSGECLRYFKLLYLYIVPYVFPLGMIAQMGSVWITVFVTLERYVAVCLPLRARSLCTYGRARICVVIISAFSIIFNIPHFWDFELYYYEDPDSQEIMVITEGSWLFENTLYFDIYIIWMNIIVIFAIPLIMLAVLNSIMWSRVRKANRERQLLSGQQKNEIKLTIMLFCVVAVFFVCNLLTMVLRILLHNDIFILEIRELSNLLVVTNSSINFVIYCSFIRKFRQIVFQLMCSPCPSRLCYRRLRARVNELDN